MKKISKKELEAKLRIYLDKASRGEKVVMTDHGEEVALMMPVPHERRVIRSLMNAQKAKWDGGKPAGIKGIRIKGKSLSWVKDGYLISRKGGFAGDRGTDPQVP